MRLYFPVLSSFLLFSIFERLSAGPAAGAVAEMDLFGRVVAPIDGFRGPVR
jgi:hypothetical protein